MALQQNYVKLQKECKAATFFDELLEIDANEISEDTSYFVFHDQIINCLKCFMRDKHAKETMAVLLHLILDTNPSPEVGIKRVSPPELWVSTLSTHIEVHRANLLPLDQELHHIRHF